MEKTGPVSYTHLDVYKRQLQGKKLPGGWFTENINCTQGNNGSGFYTQKEVFRQSEKGGMKKSMKKQRFKSGFEPPAHFDSG